MSTSEDLIVWSRNGYDVLLAARCGECQGEGRFFTNSSDNADCEHCHGQGWFGVDPHMPVMAGSGSVEKIAMLTVRYALGVPLWNPLDGPRPELAMQPVDEFADIAEDFIRTRIRRRQASAATSNGHHEQSEPRRRRDTEKRDVETAEKVSASLAP